MQKQEKETSGAPHLLELLLAWEAQLFEQDLWRLRRSTPHRITPTRLALLSDRPARTWMERRKPRCVITVQGSRLTHSDTTTRLALFSNRPAET
jgi:hypothetical protein